MSRSSATPISLKRHGIPVHLTTACDGHTQIYRAAGWNEAESAMLEMSKTLISPRENQRFAHFWHGRFRLIPPGSTVLHKQAFSLCKLHSENPYICSEKRRFCGGRDMRSGCTQASFSSWCLCHGPHPVRLHLSNLCKWHSREM